MDCQEMMIFMFLSVGLIVSFGAIYVKRAQELARERETMKHTEAALTTSPPDPSMSPAIQATLEVTEDLTVSSVPPSETGATPVKRRSRVHVSITLPKVNVANALSSATRRCSLSKLVHVPTLRNQSKERSKSAREPVHSPIIEVSEDDLHVTDVVTVAEEKINVSRRGEDDTAVLENTLTSTTTTTTSTTYSRGPVPVKPTVRSHPEVQVTTMESASSSSYSSPSTSPPLSSPSLSPSSSSSSSAALASRNPTPWPSPESSPLTPSRDLQSAAQTPRQTRKLDTSPADTVKATESKQTRQRKRLFRRVMRNGAGEPLRHADGELQRMARPACAENSLSGVVFKQGYENPFKLLIRSGSKDRAQDAQPSTVPSTSTRAGSSDTSAATRPTAGGGEASLPKDSGLRAAFRLSFSFAAIKSSSSVDVSRDIVGPYGGVPVSATSTDHARCTTPEAESASWPPSPDDSSDSNASESNSIFSLQSLSTKASSVFSGRGSSSSLKSESRLVTVAPRPTESTPTSTGDGADANAASCPSDAGMGCTNTADRGLQLVAADVDPLGVVPS